jgi:preprotein translocase subunit SecA
MLKMRGVAQCLECKMHKKHKLLKKLENQGGNHCNNMAGRGTDIKLSAEVKAAGGLAIVEQNVMIRVV